MDFKTIQELSQKTDSKIVLLVIDGIGGLPFPNKEQTALEYADTPEFDQLASKSSLGLVDTVHPGITPGSGPGHLGLFGYDPLEYKIGRGVLAALGINFDLQANDVAARINFCTLNDDGVITDRRAGRISTEKCSELVAKMQGISIEGVQCFVEPVRDHRAVVIFRGQGLSGDIEDTDPQKTGLTPLIVKARSKQAQETAKIVTQFVQEVGQKIGDQKPANGVLLRGFDTYKPIDQFEDIFHLNGAAIAVYPMYRGVARLVGMDVLETGSTLEDQLQTLKENFSKYDYFYVHIKKSDSYGEDGNFEGKVGVIEEVSRHLHQILDLKPSVLAITGDHSTPASLKGHSWHPVPLLLHSNHVRFQKECGFSEKDCAKGDIGRILGKNLMLLLLANSEKLKKYGA